MCKIYSYVYLVIESRRETSDFVVRLSIMSLHRWARRSDFREKERDCENVSCKFSLLWCNTGPDTTGPPRDLCVRELDKILLRFVQVSFFFYRTDKLIYRFVRGKSISGLDSIKSKVYTEKRRFLSFCKWSRKWSRKNAVLGNVLFPTATNSYLYAVDSTK